MKKIYKFVISNIDVLLIVVLLNVLVFFYFSPSTITKHLLITLVAILYALFNRLKIKIKYKD